MIKIPHLVTFNNANAANRNRLENYPALMYLLVVLAKALVLVAESLPYHEGNKTKNVITSHLARKRVRDEMKSIQILPYYGCLSSYVFLVFLNMDILLVNRRQTVTFVGDLEHCAGEFPEYEYLDVVLKFFFWSRIYWRNFFVELGLEIEIAIPVEIRYRYRNR